MLEISAVAPIGGWALPRPFISVFALLLAGMFLNSAAADVAVTDDEPFPAAVDVTATDDEPFSAAYSPEELGVLERRISELEARAKAKKELERRISGLESSPKRSNEEMKGRISRLEGRAKSECVIDPKKRLGIKCPNWSIASFGRLYVDLMLFSEDKHAEEKYQQAGLRDISNTRVHTGRIGAAGNYQNIWGFRLETDIAKGSVNRLRDAYLAYIGVKGLQLRAGKTKVSYSLEELTDSKFNLFMERVTPDSIGLGRMTAAAAFYAADNWSLGASVHGEGHDLDASGGGRAGDTYQADWGVSARGSWAPFYKEGRRYLHLGLGLRHVNYPQQDKRRIGFTTRAPFSNAFDFKSSKDSGVTDDEEVAGVSAGDPLGCRGDNMGVANRGGECDEVAFEDLFGWNAELAGGYGPVGFKAQYIRSEISTELVKFAYPTDRQLPMDPAATPKDERGLKGSYDFDFWYVESNWWITGESNAYDPRRGVFARVKPLNDLADGGMGAIGVAVRYNEVEFGDKKDMDFLDCSHGCKADAWTFNLTWKPNPYVKFMSEYVRAERKLIEGRDGFKDKPTAFQMRAMLDF